MEPFPTQCFTDQKRKLEAKVKVKALRFFFQQILKTEQNQMALLCANMSTSCVWAKVQKLTQFSLQCLFLFVLFWGFLGENLHSNQKYKSCTSKI